MLGKLLKHEFRADAKRLFPLLASVFTGAVLVTLLGRLITNLRPPHPYLPDSGTLYGSLGSVAVDFFVFLSTASAGVAILLLIHRYYQSLFSDEGHLTFTMPVKESTHLAAKQISAAIWMVFTIAIVFAANMLLRFFATAPRGQLVNAEGWLAFCNYWEGFLGTVSEHNRVLAIAVGAAAFLAGLASRIGSICLAVTWANLTVKKYKVAAGIGAYLAISWVVGMVTSVLMLLFLPPSAFRFSPYSLMQDAVTFFALMLPFVIPVNAGVAIAVFFMNRNLLKNKLNLD